MKILAADTWFSNAIRERDGWKCQRCGGQHVPGSRGLHAAHFVGRGNWATRFDAANAVSLCAACHFWAHGNPLLFVEWFVKRIGASKVAALRERSEDIALAKRAHRETRQIAVFYRARYEGGERTRSYFGQEGD